MESHNIESKPETNTEEISKKKDGDDKKAEGGLCFRKFQRFQMPDVPRWWQLEIIQYSSKPEWESNQSWESGDRTEMERKNNIGTVADSVINLYKRRTNLFDVHADGAAGEN
ncbi:hypothetical protein EVAR_28149_1 [Eumeta japonica]|uniref:Uncharacterized protein n=1 Tax=Eumeta variegata TaxID=151549 RepID=A0A4C1VCD2_EUMVA|nr:hypothetical protein EVAR_28149_1 [Eumeta japonica]